MMADFASIVLPRATTSKAVAAPQTSIINSRRRIASSTVQDEVAAQTRTLEHVCFSNRPVWVKRFQTTHGNDGTRSTAVPSAKMAYSRRLAALPRRFERRRRRLSVFSITVLRTFASLPFVVLDAPKPRAILRHAGVGIEYAPDAQ